MALRAMRLGYRWSEAHGCYVRISNAKLGWRIDLAPGYDVPIDKVGEHVCWWEDADALACHALAGREVEQPTTIFVDDNGYEVKPMRY